jgi:outer membrane lipoprotein carrier protein
VNGRRFALLVSVGCVLVLGLVRAIAADDPPRPDLDALEGGDKVHALLDVVVANQRALTSLKADFVQVKKSSLLLEAVESRGDFAFLAPESVRWDYAEPDQMVVLFAADQLTTYHPERQRAETVKLNRRHRRFVRVLAGTQPLDELSSQFSIALADPGGEAPYRLTLRPTHSVLKKKLASVVLEVDRQLMLPVVVEYREIDGDTTRYEFSNLELNSAVEQGLFELELGSEVEVDTIDASGGV